MAPLGPAFAPDFNLSPTLQYCAVVVYYEHCFLFSTFQNYYLRNGAFFSRDIEMTLFLLSLSFFRFRPVDEKGGGSHDKVTVV